MGRTQKATKNIVTGLVNKAALMLLAFVTKTAFIRLLGAEYNGVSSLYTNILSVLALAELGVGNVLMFYLYAALERKNEEEFCRSRRSRRFCRHFHGCRGHDVRCRRYGPSLSAR